MIVEGNSAEVVDIDTTPPPPSTPATSLHVSDDEEAAARRHACRERDARESLALSETDSPPTLTSTSRKKSRVASPAAMPAETMLECESPDFRDIDNFFPAPREAKSSSLSLEAAICGDNGIPTGDEEKAGGEESKIEA